MIHDELTITERRRLARLREEIAAGKRATDELDGPEVCTLAYFRFLEPDDAGCSCGRSDGDQCFCRSQRDL